MGKMFNLLQEGLEEAIAYEKGLSKNVRVKKVRIDTAGNSTASKRMLLGSPQGSGSVQEALSFSFIHRAMFAKILPLI